MCFVQYGLIPRAAPDIGGLNALSSCRAWCDACRYTSQSVPITRPAHFAAAGLHCDVQSKALWCNRPLCSYGTQLGRACHRWWTIAL